MQTKVIPIRVTIAGKPQDKPDPARTWAYAVPVGLVTLAVGFAGFFAYLTGWAGASAMPLLGCWLIGGFVTQLIAILPGHKSEVLMNFLDSEGICVSRSAACKKGARSRTLEAMRLKNDVIDGSLRISFSRYSTQDEVEYFVQVLKRASKTLLKAL